MKKKETSSDQLFANNDLQRLMNRYGDKGQLTGNWGLDAETTDWEVGSGPTNLQVKRVFIGKTTEKH